MYTFQWKVTEIFIKYKNNEIGLKSNSNYNKNNQVVIINWQQK